MPEQQITLLSRVAHASVGTHEYSVWSDGSVSIEHAFYQYDPDNPNLFHVTLSAERASALRSLLNTADALRSLLAITTEGGSNV